MYLGGYNLEEHAASAHDVAAIKLKRAKAKTNFPRESYNEIEKSMELFTFGEMVMALRRQSAGLSRPHTSFIGVVRSRNGKWEGRVVIDGRTLHLGLFNTDIEAAQAYDAAVREHRTSITHHVANEMPLNFPEGGRAGVGG